MLPEKGTSWNITRGCALLAVAAAVCAVYICTQYRNSRRRRRRRRRSGIPRTEYIEGLLSVRRSSENSVALYKYNTRTHARMDAHGHTSCLSRTLLESTVAAAAFSAATSVPHARRMGRQRPASLLYCLIIRETLSEFPAHVRFTFSPTYLKETSPIHNYKIIHT